MYTPSSQRSANRHLSLPRRGLGKQEIRNVGTGDEQHKTYGAKKNVKRQTNVAHDVFQIRSPTEAEAGGSRKHIRKSVGLVFRNCIEICGDARCGNTGTQACNHAKKMRVAHLQTWICSCPRHPQPDRRIELKVTRQNANYLVVDIVEAHRFADGVFSAAKLTLPQAIRSEEHMVAALSGFFGHKIPAM